MLLSRVVYSPATRWSQIHRSTNKAALKQAKTAVIFLLFLLFIITSFFFLWSSDMPRPAGPAGDGGGVPAQEEGEDDISGTQFVCETVIRSMTLEEAPDHAPLRGPRPGTGDDHSNVTKGKGNIND